MKKSSEVNNKQIDQQSMYEFTHPIWIQLRDSGFRYPPIAEYSHYSHQPGFKKKNVPPAFYQNSIAGFHNPLKHKGLTPDAFLNLYLKRLDQRGKYDMARQVREKRQEVLVFLIRRFPHTLKPSDTAADVSS